MVLRVVLSATLRIRIDIDKPPFLSSVLGEHAALQANVLPFLD